LLANHELNTDKHNKAINISNINWNQQKKSDWKLRKSLRSEFGRWGLKYRISLPILCGEKKFFFGPVCLETARNILQLSILPFQRHKEIGGDRKQIHNNYKKKFFFDVGCFGRDILYFRHPLPSNVFFGVCCFFLRLHIRMFNGTKKSQ
jgi:hypothetical protein